MGVCERTISLLCRFKSKWIFKKYIYEFEMNFKKSLYKQYNLTKFFRGQV